jgi:hypothetical protein
LLRSSQTVPPGHDSTNIDSPSHRMKPLSLMANDCVPSTPVHGFG